MVRSSLVCVVAVVVAMGCEDSGGGGSAPPGSEGAPCYGNGTCDDGLTCLSDVCVKAAGGGKDDGGRSPADTATGEPGDVGTQTNGNGEYPGPCVEDFDDGPGVGVDYRKTWTYDGNGNVLSEEQDHGPDGTVNYRTTWTYDTSGNMLTKEVDTDADGTVDYRTTWTYDANGNLLSDEWDKGADGTVDKRRTFDTSGNLLSEEKDTVGDGVMNWRLTRTYDCWQ